MSKFYYNHKLFILLKNLVISLSLSYINSLSISFSISKSPTGFMGKSGSSVLVESFQWDAIPSICHQFTTAIVTFPVFFL